MSIENLEFLTKNTSDKSNNLYVNHPVDDQALYGQSTKRYQTQQGNVILDDSSIPKNIDYINYLAVEIKLPKIILNTNAVGKYRIRWCKNVGLNIVGKAVLKKGDSELCSIDADSNYMTNSYKIPSEKQGTWKELMGNTPDLTDTKKTSIPEKILIVPVFIFCMKGKTENALPAFKFHNEGLKFVVTPETSLSKFLILEEKTNDGWQMAKVSGMDIGKYIKNREVLEGVKMRKIANVQTVKTQDHRNFLIDSINDVIIEKCIVLEGEPTNKPVIKQTIDYNGPVSCMIFAVKNQTASVDYNSHSNYSTFEYYPDGYNPIKSYTLEVGGKKFIDKATEEMSSIDSLFYAKNSKVDTGLFSILHTNNTNKIGRGTCEYGCGDVKAALTINLGEGNSYQDDSIKKDLENTYKPIICLMIPTIYDSVNGKMMEREYTKK